MKKITITNEINNNGILEGTIVEWVDLNRIAYRKGMPLLYIKNIMDDNTGEVYAWFKDNAINANYLLKIR